MKAESLDAAASELTGWLDRHLRRGQDHDRAASARVLLSLAALQQLATRSDDLQDAWHRLRSFHVRHELEGPFDEYYTQFTQRVENRVPALHEVFTRYLAPDVVRAGSALRTWLLTLPEWPEDDSSPEYLSAGSRTSRGTVWFGQWFGTALDERAAVLARSGSYVPQDVARLMAVLSEQPGARSVLDLRCGLGTVLAAALADEHAVRRSDAGKVRAVGVEASAAICALARLRMHFERPNARIVLDSALRREHLWGEFPNERFDRVLAPVPLGVKISPEDAWHITHSTDLIGGAPLSGLSADAAYILRGVSQLTERGRLVALVSPGFLFREGTDAQLRGRLVDHDLVDAVIHLPLNALPTTAVAPALVIVDHRKSAARRGSILMVDLAVGQTRGARRSTLSDEAVAVLAGLVAGVDEVPNRGRGYSDFTFRDSDLLGRVGVVVGDEVRRRDFSLHPRRYLVDAPLARRSIRDQLEDVYALEAEARSAAYEMDRLLTALTHRLGH